MTDYSELEKRLRELLKGEHSSLHLDFNSHASSYITAAENEEIGRSMNAGSDWVSDEERERALASNCVWTLQWYPDTPVGSYSVSASSLEALLTHCLSRADGDKGSEGQ